METGTTRRHWSSDVLPSRLLVESTRIKTGLLAEQTSPLLKPCWLVHDVPLHLRGQQSFPETPFPGMLLES